MAKSNTPAPGQVDVSDESIHWDLKDTLSYGGYLKLDGLLSCQVPLGNAHDEMMFIIIHQQAELWMKLSLFEIQSAIQHIQQDQVSQAMKMLARLAMIQRQLISSWDVLATLTPADYLLFRDSLGPSSGFQSHQYRMLEFILGNKNPQLIEVHAHNPKIYTILATVLNQPSLYDEVLLYMGRQGFKIQGYTPDAVSKRDWCNAYTANESVETAWLEIYSSIDKHWELYDLAEKLVDLEDRFQQWRFRHMKTVERIIGFKTGTGGSSGVSYLQKALNLRFFPELWSLRTKL